MPAQHSPSASINLSLEDEVLAERDGVDGAEGLERLEGVGGGGAGGWYIPRAALCRNDTTCSCSQSSSTQRSIHTVNEWLSPTPSSSTTSTQSGSSGSLLLTAANLAALRLEPRACVVKDPDDCANSIASSTHFTVVNYGGSYRQSKPNKESVCARHTVSALVITTCSIFLLGLLAAVYYMDRSEYLSRLSSTSISMGALYTPSRRIPTCRLQPTIWALRRYGLARLLKQEVTGNYRSEQPSPNTCRTSNIGHQPELPPEVLPEAETVIRHHSQIGCPIQVI